MDAPSDPLNELPAGEFCERVQGLGFSSSQPKKEGFPYTLNPKPHCTGDTPLFAWRLSVQAEKAAHDPSRKRTKPQTESVRV